MPSGCGGWWAGGGWAATWDWVVNLAGLLVMSHVPRTQLTTSWGRKAGGSIWVSRTWSAGETTMHARYGDHGARNEPTGCPVQGADFFVHPKLYFQQKEHASRTAHSVL